MKNGKAPTREQKKIMKAHGLVPENWLVVKNLPDSLEVVSRVSLKKVGGNWVNIVVGEADWVEEGDSILKAKVAVQFDITFEGGIYQDRDIKPMDIGSVG